jgi:hypothetical protein
MSHGILFSHNIYLLCDVSIIDVYYVLLIIYIISEFGDNEWSSDKFVPLPDLPVSLSTSPAPNTLTDAELMAIEFCSLAVMGRCGGYWQKHENNLVFLSSQVS